MAARIIDGALLIAVLGVGSDSLRAQAYSWTQLVPAIHPSSRFGHGMAYDAARDRVVLFGGVANIFASDETWEWTGTTWVQHAPASHPIARAGHAIAYDSTRQRVVLFGGTGASGTYLADTWEWDGVSWIARFSANHPSARTGAAMGYDSMRQRIVLFGGGQINGAAPFLNDTWEWDGTNWLQAAPLVSPTPRADHALAYDAARQQMLLFGGVTNTSTYFQSDTWLWDGTSWQPAAPQTTPPARSEFGMAYSTTRQRVFAFAGRGNTSPMTDTWMWDGLTWVEVFPFPNAIGRSGHSMVFDSARDVMLMFGGRHSFPSYEDTWSFSSPGIVAAATAYGNGCGSPPVVLSPDPSHRPISGQSGTALISSAPTSVGAMMLGFSNQSYGPFALPVTLTGVGMPGCDLLQSADIMGFPVTSLSAGSMVFSAFLPPIPSLVNAHVYLQAYVLAPGANSLGILVSNGLDWFVGDA